MPAYTPRVIVTVNGVRRRTLGGTTICGFVTGFSTASVRFAYDTPKPDPGSALAVMLGYDETGQQVVFVGEIDDNGRDFWPRTRSVTASGTLARMQRGLNQVDDSADIDPVTLEKPAYVAIGQTDAQIVAALCALYAIPAADIHSDVDNGGPRTFGNIEPVRLAKNQAAWGLVQDLDRLTFMVTFNAPDGTARRLSVNGIPSSAALTLTQGSTLARGTAGESRKGIVNAVTMKGLPDAGGPGVTPSAERRALSPYIPAPPTYVPEEWQSALAETEFLCDLYASRRVGQLNRLQGQTVVRPHRARPDIYPAMSLALDAAQFEYGPTSRFWVAQVQHSWNAQGIATDLTLTVASLSGGVNPNQPPVPLIISTIHKEVLADGSTIWVLVADGRASYDPDGVEVDLDPRHGITTYLWSGSPVSPSTPVALPIAVFIYHSDPTGAQICLTVADVQLKEATACVTVTATDVGRAMTRDLWAATTTDLLFFSGTLGRWAAVGVAAVGCCEIAHPLYQLAWTSAGTLWRITVDDAGTFHADSALTGGLITAASINLGVNGTGTRRAWAGGSDGKVYLSVADGDPGTWAQVGTITAPAGSTDNHIRAIEESPFASGALLALCGDALCGSFDRGATWHVVKAYPDAALNAVRLATGRFADLTVNKSYQWVAFAGTSSSVSSRLHEATEQEAVDWPTPAKPAQPTGLTIGAKTPGLYLTDLGGAGTGRTWALDDFTGGGNLVQRAYDAAYGPPRHIIRDSEFDGTIYGAGDAHLFKTDDYFVSTLDLLDLATAPGAASQVGKMIGFGALQATKTPPGELIVSAKGQGTGDHWIIRRTTTGLWQKLSDHPVPEAAVAAMLPPFASAWFRPLLRCGEVLFTWLAHVDQASGLRVGSVNAFRSTDWGATWTALTIAAVNWLAVDADGTTLYALHNTVADVITGSGFLTNTIDTISRSTDGGVTWTARTTTIPAGFIGAPGGATIACSPLTHNTVALLHGDGFNLSHDGGATFGATYGPQSQTHFPSSGAQVRTPGDGAQVAAINNGGVTSLWRVPDGQAGTAVVPSIGGDAVMDIKVVGGIIYLANGGLRYSTDDGTTWSTARTPPDPTGDPIYDPQVHAIAADPGGTILFAAGTWGGSVPTTHSWPLYWTYTVDSDRWIDVTGTQYADLGHNFAPHLWGMIVKPGG